MIFSEIEEWCFDQIIAPCQRHSHQLVQLVVYVDRRDIESS